MEVAPPLNPPRPKLAGAVEASSAWLRRVFRTVPKAVLLWSVVVVALFALAAWTLLPTVAAVPVCLGLGLLWVGWARWRTARRAPRRALSFTREGKALVVITLGVGFAAVNTGNNLLYLVLGMLLSMIIVSGVLSEQTLRRLEVTRELPRQAFAGRPFLTGITLVNRKRRLPSFSVQVEDVVEGQPLAKKCYFLKVPAGARQQTSYRAELTRRGRYRYEGLRLGTRFPFSFFVKMKRYDAPAELLVLPRVHPVGALLLEAGAPRGVVERPRRGAGREFHGLRAYRPGDDARDIHWKRSAREGRLVLREYQSEGGRAVTVLLNDRVPAGLATDPVAADELEQCVDLAASLVVHFAERGHRVELRTVGGERRLVGADCGGLNGALEMLALVPFVEGPPPAADRLPLGPALLVTHRRARALAPSARYSHVFEQGAG